MAQQASKPEESYALNPTDEIFKGDVTEKAREIEKKLQRRRWYTSYVHACAYVCIFSFIKIILLKYFVH